MERKFLIARNHCQSFAFGHLALYFLCMQPKKMVKMIELLDYKMKLAEQEFFAHDSTCKMQNSIALHEDKMKEQENSITEGDLRNRLVVGLGSWKEKAENVIKTGHIEWKCPLQWHHHLTNPKRLSIFPFFPCLFSFLFCCFPLHPNGGIFLKICPNLVTNINILPSFIRKVY